MDGKWLKYAKNKNKKKIYETRDAATKCDETDEKEEDRAGRTNKSQQNLLYVSGNLSWTKAIFVNYCLSFRFHLHCPPKNRHDRLRVRAPLRFGRFRLYSVGFVTPINKKEERKEST